MSSSSSLSQRVRPDLLQYASALTQVQLEEVKQSCGANTACIEPRLQSLDLLLSEDESKQLDCVDKVMVDCGSDRACKERLRTDCFNSSDPPEFTFREALEAQLRQNLPRSEKTVALALAERVNYSKKPAGPITEAATEVRFDAAGWYRLFGTPSATTKVPAVVAGFIAEILSTEGESSKLKVRLSQIYVDRLATEALADPALASLREYFIEPPNTAVFDLRGAQDLFRLKAFFKFGNPLVKEKLMAHRLPALVTKMALEPGLTGAELQTRAELLLDGLQVYAERKEFDMFRFFVLLFAAVRKAASVAPANDRLFLLFSSAAQTYSATGDIRYLRGFFSLHIAGWETWAEAVQQMYSLPWTMQNLVRISRLYTLNNPLESEFHDPDDTVVPPATAAYMSQAKNPTLAEVVAQSQKQFVY